MVAVTSAYGLVTVSIALDSVLLVFGNAVILLLILFVLFGWKELLGEFGKKQSAVAARCWTSLLSILVLILLLVLARRPGRDAESV